MNQEDTIVTLLLIAVAGGVFIVMAAGMFRHTSNHTLKRYIAGMSVNVLGAIGRVVGGYALVLGGIIMLGCVVTTEIPPPIKLIMLDIDGVLNHDKAPERLNVSHLYDPECVERFNTLVETHKAKIVVCSAWRIGQTIESMQETLDSIGVKGEVIGLTPWYEGYHTRDDEITAWLQGFDQLDDLEAFLVIDDDTSDRFESYQVKPSWDEFGFRQDHLEQADAVLSRKMPKKFDIGKVNVCESEVKEEMNFGGHNIRSGPSSSPKRS